MACMHVSSFSQPFQPRGITRWDAYQLLTIHMLLLGFDLLAANQQACAELMLLADLSQLIKDL